MSDAVRPRIPLWIALAAAVLIGALTAVQARVNGQLGVALDDGLLAALVSFAVGLILVVIIATSTVRGRSGIRALGAGVRGGAIPVWMVLGGVAGALTVATQTLTVAIIGVSLFTVGMVAGQAICGLVVDRIGFGPAGVVAITVPRVAGGVLALAAIAVSLSPDVLASTPWWMLALPLLAGLGVAWQQAVNGRLRIKVGTPIVATLVNFIGGTTILAITAGVSVLTRQQPIVFPTEPWLYLGGAMGLVYILLSVALVARTGVLLLGLASVVGQILASVLIDFFWPAASALGSLQSVVMVTIALASVVVATLPWRTTKRSGTTSASQATR